MSKRRQLMAVGTEHAASVSSTPVRLSDDELLALCREWQKRLGLSHWQIFIRYRRRCDIHNESDASVQIIRERLYAEISICDPVDVEPGRTLPFDTEQSIVHELVHCVWDALDPERGTESWTQMEIATDMTARAFVAVKRESAHR